MYRYKIPGLIKKQKLYFHEYYYSASKKQQFVIESIRSYLGKLGNNLVQKGLFIESLQQNYTTALYNLEGLLALYDRRSNRYTNLYSLIESKKILHRRLRDRLIILQLIPSQNQYHKIILNSHFLNVYFSFTSLSHPDEYFEVLTSILFLRLLRKKVPTSLKEKLLSFENMRQYSEQGRYRSGLNSKKAQGKHFHLGEIFQRLNIRYFDDKLERPILKWSRKANRRRLGFYNEHQNQIIINKLLDHSDIPKFVVEGILYHEMLHILHPTHVKNGRNQIHGKNFKNDERKYEFYTNLQNWLKNEFPMLIRKFDCKEK